MYILGINFSHNSAACLIKDGDLVAASEEERFDKKKYSPAYPYRAIDFCLNKAGITIKDIDRVGYGWNRWLLFKKRLFWHNIKYYPRSSVYFAYCSQDVLIHYLIRTNYLIRRLGFKGKVNFITHHASHASSAFFVSPFKRSAILTIDGSGEYSSSGLYLGQENRIIKLEEIEFPNSIGWIYAAVCVFLGFDIFEGPGKVMGLAAYGEPAYYEAFKKIIHMLPGGRFGVDVNYLNFPFWRLPYFTKKFTDIFGRPRSKEEPFTKRHQDIAKSLQKIAEDLILHVATHLSEITKEESLCLAGGVALNSVANTHILGNTPFKNIFIQPAAGDAGTAIGAAYYIYNQILGNKRSFVMKDAFYGPGYSNEDIKAALEQEKLNYEFSPGIAKAVAGLLSGGKIGGWFQGRMEWGPRALGNRSIIADPRRKDMVGLVNSKVKHREWFRPFAPSVLEEYFSEYFNGTWRSPFMLLVNEVLPDKRDRIPAVVHVDNTARAQAVRKDENPLFWELINEFRKLTGIPLILNTSFNIRAPIVCSPLDAISCFRNSEMDFLAIGDFLVMNNDKDGICVKEDTVKQDSRMGFLRRLAEPYRILARIFYFCLFLLPFLIWRLASLFKKLMDTKK